MAQCDFSNTDLYFTMEEKMEERAAKPTKISINSTKTFKRAVTDFFLSKKKKRANTPEILKLKQLPEVNIYKVIYDVANEIVVCYGYQIGSLNTASDIQSLAEFTVFCMLETLRSEDVPFNRNRMLLSILERNDLSVLKRNYGFEDREVFTTSGKTWRLSEIFREPGICMPVVEKEKGDIKMMLYQGMAGEEKYGFRFPLTVWDEDQQKFAVCDGDQQYMDSCDYREDDQHSLLSNQSLPTLVLYNSDLFLEYIKKAASEKKKMTFGDFVNGKAQESYLFIVLRPVDGFSSTATPFLETMAQCDFSNTDLSFLRFSKITKEINGCSFSSGNLSNTDMSGVVITESDFSYADFSFAFLIGSNLKNSKNTWKKAVFWYTDLSNAKLSEELECVLKKWNDRNLEGSTIYSHPTEEMASESKTIHEDDSTDDSTEVKSPREGAEAVDVDEEDFQDVQSKKGASQLPEREEDPDTVDSFQESGDHSEVFLPMEPDRGKMQTPLSELSEDNSQQIRQEADQLNTAMAGSGDVNFVYAWAAWDARDLHNVFLVVYVRSLEENRCLFLKQKLEEMKFAKYKIWQFNKPIRSKFPRCPNNMEPVPPNWVCKMWKILYEHSMKLFQEHSNISYITASKFEIDRNGQCHRKDCVVVYVRDKGYIPANERSFPKRLPNGISVDVREGYYCPLMDHEEGAGTTVGWAGVPRRVAQAGSGAAGEGAGSQAESAGALEETARNCSGDGAPGVEVEGGRDEAAGEGTRSPSESTRPGGVTGAIGGGGAAPNVENRGIGSRDWAHGEIIEFLRAAAKAPRVDSGSAFKQHLTIGCGISRHNDHYYSTGTLGMFVKDMLTKEIGLLTAAHTLIAQTQMVIPVPGEIVPLAVPMEGSMYPSDRSFTMQVSDEQTNSPSSVPTTTPQESANASPDLRPSPVVGPVQPSLQISPFTSLPAGLGPATFWTDEEPNMLPEASGYASCPDAVVSSQSRSPVGQTPVAETNQPIPKMADVSSTSRPLNITSSTVESLQHRTPSESAVPQDMPPTLVPSPQISPLNLRGPQYHMQGSSEELPAETFVVQPSEGEASWLCWSSDGNESYNVENRKCAEVKSPRMYCYGVSQSQKCDLLLKMYHQTEQPGPVPVGIDAVFASILKPRQPENSSFLHGKVSFNKPSILNLKKVMRILNGEWEAEPCIRKELDGTFSLEVFKYGFSSQLKRGKLNFIGGIPSVIPWYGCSTNGNFLPNQMEVQSFDDQSTPFAVQGDSGAIVFTILKQSVHIVGMVIGRIGEIFVVTPIEPIFEKLGLEFLEKQDYPTA